MKNKVMSFIAGYFVGVATCWGVFLFGVGGFALQFALKVIMASLRG